MYLPRRSFLHTTALAGMAWLFKDLPSFSAFKEQAEIACQQYTWFSYFRREGKEWGADLNASFQALAAAGLQGYEPSFEDTGQVDPVREMLARNKLWTRSMYVNSTLHEEGEWEASIAGALAIARKAKKMGVEIVVTNPSPIQWGQPIDKTDDQLKLQAKALDHLGAELRQMGMKLAYHNHDMEMRQSAREFHHMMLATDPQNVHLCLDAHWVYRGAGDSEVALFDIVNLYGDRIVEVHIRQSQKGVWSEVFGEGDIDYGRLVEELRKKKISPHLVLEQAVEEGTPHTMDAVAAIGKSAAAAQSVFEELAPGK